MIFTGYYNVSWVNSRRGPEAHPSEPMEDDEYKVFQRKTRPECTLSSLYFTVLKEREFDPARNIFLRGFMQSLVTLLRKKLTLLKRIQQTIEGNINDKLHL